MTTSELNIFHESMTLLSVPHITKTLCKHSDKGSKRTKTLKIQS